MRTISNSIFATVLLAATSTVATAQQPEEPDEPDEPAPDPDPIGTPDATAPPTPSSQLPPPRSDSDPQPPVPAVGVPPGGIVRQAGVGGPVGYARAGVLELGGSAGFAFASDYRNVNVSPTIGWFLVDNLELSAILSISNIETGDESATLWSALIEPSYHVPFNRSVFGFLGLGVGAAYVSGPGTGFAIAPRVGANLMVGRSGVLTPSLSYEYTTVSTDDAESETEDVTLVALTSTLRFNVGYTAMW
jgi:hypothetical protein